LAYQSLLVGFCAFFVSTHPHARSYLVIATGAAWRVNQFAKVIFRVETPARYQCWPNWTGVQWPIRISGADAFALEDETHWTVEPLIERHFEPDPKSASLVEFTTS
jgi:hypothetical protein